MTVSQLVDGEWVTLTDEEHIEQLVAQCRAEGWEPCLQCFQVLDDDGTCGYCRWRAAFSADPEYREWSDAQARLDFGAWAPESTRPYTFDDRQADRAIVKRLEAKFVRAERAAETEPGGCALCGVAERKHAQRYSSAHLGDRPKGYVAPSAALRKARMVARRNVRTGRPAWAPLALGGAS